MEVFFDHDGTTIVRRNGKLSIQFDSGELVSKQIEFEITEDEARKLQNGELDEYKFIIQCERDHRFSLRSNK